MSFRAEASLLFTGIEGSTRLLRELREEYAGVLAEHRRMLRATFGRHGASPTPEHARAIRARGTRA